MYFNRCCVYFESQHQTWGPYFLVVYTGWQWRHCQQRLPPPCWRYRLPYCSSVTYVYTYICKLTFLDDWWIIRYLSRWARLSTGNDDLERDHHWRVYHPGVYPCNSGPLSLDVLLCVGPTSTGDGFGHRSRRNGQLCVSNYTPVEIDGL